jgi:chromosome segregation ATPase
MTDQLTPPADSTNAEAAKLTRRRAKVQKATAASVTARSELADLDAQLESLTAARRQQKAAIRDAKKQKALAEETIKALTKRRRSLKESRKKARNTAAKAARRAHEVEAKYERAVLADMVREQKRADLSTHTTRGAAPGTAVVDQPPVKAVTAIARARSLELEQERKAAD